MAIAPRRLRQGEFADGLGRHERPRGLRRHLRRAAYVFWLGAPGVAGAGPTSSTFPDWRDTRALIVTSAPSQPLLGARTARYPPDALAVQVKSPGAPSETPPRDFLRVLTLVPPVDECTLPYE